MGSVGTRTDVDFGYRGYTMISDLVWVDSNADEAYTPGETVLPGIRVFIDLNGDGTWSANEPHAVTDSIGLYKIEGLVVGQYQVRVDASTLPAGSVPRYDYDELEAPNTPNLDTLNLLPNHQLTDIDFGYLGSGSISGSVINDGDANGSQNGAESGIPGVVVQLDRDNNNNGVYDAGDTFVARTVTDGLGHYEFLNVSAGNYVEVAKNEIVRPQAEAVGDRVTAPDLDFGPRHTRQHGFVSGRWASVRAEPDDAGCYNTRDVALVSENGKKPTVPQRILYCPGQAFAFFDAPDGYEAEIAAKRGEERIDATEAGTSIRDNLRLYAKEINPRSASSRATGTVGGNLRASFAAAGDDLMDLGRHAFVGETRTHQHEGTESYRVSPVQMLPYAVYDLDPVPV